MSPPIEDWIWRQEMTRRHLARMPGLRRLGSMPSSQGHTQVTMLHPVYSTATTYFYKGIYPFQVFPQDAHQRYDIAKLGYNS